MLCGVAFFYFLRVVRRDATTTVAPVALRWRFGGAFGLSQVVAMFAVVVSVALVALFCQELCSGCAVLRIDRDSMVDDWAKHIERKSATSATS